MQTNWVLIHCAIKAFLRVFEEMQFILHLLWLPEIAQKNAVTQAKAMNLPLYLHLQFKTDNYVQETQEQLDLFKTMDRVLSNKSGWISKCTRCKGRP